MNIQQPQTTLEAVTLGLFLSLTAPTEQQAQQAVDMAQGMASGLSLEEVETAKTEALTMAQEHWGEVA